MFKKVFKFKDFRVIRFSSKRVFFVLIFILLFFLLLFTLLYFYAYSYRDKVLPGVYLGDISIGSMNREELTDFIQKMETKLSDEGIEFYFDIDKKQEKIILYPNITTENFVENIIDIDVREEVDYFLSFRKSKNIFSNITATIFTRFSKPKLKLQKVSLQKQKLFFKLEELVKAYITEPVDAKLTIKSLTPFDYEISSSTAGVTFNYEKVAGKILNDWSILKSPNIKIETFERKPEIVKQDILSIIDKSEDIFSYGQIDILYTDPHNRREYKWYLNSNELKDFIKIIKNEEDKVIFSLDQEELLNFIEIDIVPFVNINAQDAKFELGENGKVTEFQGSRLGIRLETDKTIEDINTAFESRNYYDEGIIKSINITIDTVEPKIKTGEVNDMGISEILGIGYSNFRGSSNLRIKNIQNAAFNKLNGLLIKPDEEFSLVSALSPFTTEAGYYPELVIKGDRVIPEIGGGLCQIGTTIFRTTMNSGLKITERRNHSLVVSYYNDARNGLPGTDATIYDPHPDFRFLNDTGNNILITADINLTNHELSFTFWGTSDGRKGYYSAPVVTEWFYPGEERIIETTNLEPGVKECQHEYIGAKAFFTYTKILADGEKVDRVFDSYYRPLARTCLLGVEDIVESEEEKEDENESDIIENPVEDERNANLEGEIIE